MATAASVLLVLEIGAPDGANAIGQRLLRTFKQLGGNVAQTLQSFDRREPRNDAPPPPNSSPSAMVTREIDLGMAKAQLLIFKSGESRVTWIEGSVSFGLSGRVDIAQSLK